MLLGLILWGALCDLIGNYIPFAGMLDVLGLALGYANNFISKLFFGLWGLFL